jgi:transcription initiation factor TFIIH subunit 1
LTFEKPDPKKKKAIKEMTTSSEDILRVVENVRVKKNDGTLYMMAERIAWMPNGKDTFTISHKYADIKTQKISPEGKAKIQLQIVLNSGSDTFHFVNPNGLQNQLNDRNEVKELLQQLLPQFKRKLSKEMEEKSRILTDNPELYQLYKELVISNIITADEFWANYAAKKLTQFKGKPFKTFIYILFVRVMVKDSDYIQFTFLLFHYLISLFID